MRQVIRILLTFLILFIGFQPSYAIIKGGLEYQIPIDYTKINQEEAEMKAAFYYNLAQKTQTMNEEMTYALNLYSILSNKNPNKVLYPIRLGILYDILKMDKYAKGNFNKAISMDRKNPEPYFYFGEFYYKRHMLRKALKMYKKAYENGYSSHKETTDKIIDIYQKLGNEEKMYRK